MQLELSETERRTLIGALNVYRRIKSAESKLTSQKEKTREDMAHVEGRYKTLLACATRLQARLEGENA